MLIIILWTYQCALTSKAHPRPFSNSWFKLLSFPPGCSWGGITADAVVKTAAQAIQSAGASWQQAAEYKLLLICNNSSLPGSAAICCYSSLKVVPGRKFWEFNPKSHFQLVFCDIIKITAGQKTSWVIWDMILQWGMQNEEDFVLCTQW